MTGWVGRGVSPTPSFTYRLKKALESRVLRPDARVPTPELRAGPQLTYTRKSDPTAPKPETRNASYGPGHGRVGQQAGVIVCEDRHGAVGGAIGSDQCPALASLNAPDEQGARAPTPRRRGKHGHRHVHEAVFLEDQRPCIGFVRRWGLLCEYVSHAVLRVSGTTCPFSFTATAARHDTGRLKLRWFGRSACAGATWQRDCRSNPHSSGRSRPRRRSARALGRADRTAHGREVGWLRHGSRREHLPLGTAVGGPSRRAADPQGSSR